MINGADCDKISITEKVRKLLEETGVEAKFGAELAKLTTFGVGGKAETAVYPSGIEQLDAVLAATERLGLERFVLGRGSNVLASDKGYGGVLIVLRNNLSQISFSGNAITAEAGASTAQVARLAAEKELAGCEFLSLLPASIGGAVVMNAGCFGFNMAGIVQNVYATKGKGIEVFPHESCGFGYRSSVFAREGWTVGKIEIALEKGSRGHIEALANSLAAKKRSTQPIGERTAGSVFLNGKEPAAKLIEQIGLKGFRLGGAEISKKHSNFIVNTGNATQKEISDLICVVQNAVREKTGVSLEQEIKFLGD